ncbi:hypothetical protein SteCoe_21796 [Stentor coeruleus]|uniref:Uncharacterized protein n=1 Tax=Stentor coeruleus TaxID=5963 RepID=A0A1R2BNR7_9CILI|nr:hypothetical protein SteCoe_21796 [Stentor coeruleus]
MVLSGFLALQALWASKEKEWNEKKVMIEAGAFAVLFVEMLLSSAYEYIQCTKLYSSQCLKSLEHFELSLLMLTISLQGFSSLLPLLWVLAINLYMYSEYFSKSAFKFFCLLHFLCLFQCFYKFWLHRKDENSKFYVILIWLFGATGYLIFLQGAKWDTIFETNDALLLIMFSIGIYIVKRDVFKRKINSA